MDYLFAFYLLYFYPSPPKKFFYIAFSHDLIALIVYVSRRYISIIFSDYLIISMSLNHIFRIIKLAMRSRSKYSRQVNIHGEKNIHPNKSNESETPSINTINKLRNRVACISSFSPYPLSETRFRCSPCQRKKGQT
jgi:hypothetical protein